MNEAEVEVVAEELAKLGGTAWYPGREPGPLLRVVQERYRDRARAAIAALDRFRASATKANPPEGLTDGLSESGTKIDVSPSDTEIQIGTTVIYRPDGDRRAYSCKVQKITDGFAYLVPEDRTGIGWVPLKDLVGHSAASHSEQDK